MQLPKIIFALLNKIRICQLVLTKNSKFGTPNVQTVFLVDKPMDTDTNAHRQGALSQLPPPPEDFWVSDYLST